MNSTTKENYKHYQLKTVFLRGTSSDIARKTTPGKKYSKLT